MRRPRRPRRRAAARPWWRIGLDAVRVAVLAVAILAIIEYFGGAKLTGELTAVDGDSLRGPDGDIRLHGIDAPELGQTCEAAGERYDCGRAARDHLRRLMRAGPVTCEVRDSDRYGRAVAVCRAGATELNRQMALDGWAVAYVRHGSDYVREAEEARRAARGLWRGHFDPPEQWRTLNRAEAGGTGD